MFGADSGKEEMGGGLTAEMDRASKLMTRVSGFESPEMGSLVAIKPPKKPDLGGLKMYSGFESPKFGLLVDFGVLRMSSGFEIDSGFEYP